MIVPLTLSALIARCAPAVGPITMSAIVEYESAGRPNAIGDNTARRSYDPSDRRNAIALARALIERGHNIDVGYAQVNSGNFGMYGLSVAAALDPCTNIATAAAILQSDYVAAIRTYAPGQNALVHALSAYNSGDYRSGLRYARSVFATASQMRNGAPERAVAFGSHQVRPIHAREAER